VAGEAFGVAVMARGKNACGERTSGRGWGSEGVCVRGERERERERETERARARERETACDLVAPQDTVAEDQRRTSKYPYAASALPVSIRSLVAEHIIVLNDDALRDRCTPHTNHNSSSSSHRHIVVQSQTWRYLCCTSIINR